MSVHRQQGQQPTPNRARRVPVTSWVGIVGTALMALLRQHDVNALFVMQPLHPMVFKDLARFEPIQRDVAALCQRYAMTCMDMYSAPFEVGMLRDVQHLGELGWLRVNQKIAQVFRP